MLLHLNEYFFPIFVVIRSFIVDLLIMTDASFLQADKAATGTVSPYMCISDFIAPVDTGVQDYIGMFAVSVGFGCEELCEGLVVYMMYLCS